LLDPTHAKGRGIPPQLKHGGFPIKLQDEITPSAASGRFRPAANS
jgi:hypothetical protein